MNSFGINNYWLFLLSGIILNLTPGADTIYILTRSISQGRSAGIASVFGIGSGGIIHILLATFGLSIILSKSIVLFNIIKIVGAIYLVFIGILTLRSKDKLFITDDRRKNNTGFLKIYLQGVLTNLFNPKVALFFISFLPQFIDAPQASGPIPFLILGLTFFTTGTIWCLMLAFFSSLITERLRRNVRISEIMQKLTGFVFIALGLKIALSKK
jgi:threonine/homoserine/homoserine lactone efflux protein